MSESKHSPEPWRHEDMEGGIVSSEGPALCAEGWPCGRFEAEGRMVANANAHRIVACVNACAGIPTDALEEGAISDAIDTLLVILGSQPHWEGVRKALRKMGRVP